MERILYKNFPKCEGQIIILQTCEILTCQTFTMVTSQFSDA